MQFLAWLELTAASEWVRGSPSLFAFPAILSCHTVGMGLAAGINGAIAFRVLGVAPGVPVAEMRRFLPAMWFGFWLNLFSGIGLLIGYPTKALTNPDFYLKLALIAGGVWLVGKIRDRIETFPKSLAVWSLICWGGAITSGRLLAYTYRHLLAGM
ncbi:MAG TPA: hypothetical protein VLV86_09570 [Vicinamibacterales bacterium]|nr:hypothetical protein [Vicinamibacterales bacterium]